MTVDVIRILSKTECPNETTKNAFLFSCFTGLRISDIRALKWKEIRKESNGFVLYFKQLKTNETLRIPLSSQALEFIGEKDASNDFVYNLASKKYVKKHLDEWAEDSGIDKKITYHVSRHTFATLALTSDIDIKTVSTILGHSEVKTTEIYAKIIDKKKEEAVKKLPHL